MQQTTSLYTFGYEGLTLEAFIARLKEMGVRAVIDVRELPLSRKKGFSKRAFSEALHRAGIAYAHRPALGCPKPIRDAYRANGDWSAYSRKFMAHLDQQEAALIEVTKISSASSACLVCFEADFNFCHRSMVARAVARVGGLAVVHLTAGPAIPDVPAVAAAKDNDPAANSSVNTAIVARDESLSGNTSGISWHDMLRNANLRPGEISVYASICGSIPAEETDEEFLAAIEAMS